MYGEPKNVIALSMQKTQSQLRDSKLPEFVYRRIWSIMEFGKIDGYVSSRYRVCTKAMFISKENYGYGEPKNVIALSV